MERGVTAECSVDIGASCAAVFDIVHDFGIRLQWDTLLSEARIVDETAREAGASLARMEVETVYVRFDRPQVAVMASVKRFMEAREPGRS